MTDPSSSAVQANSPENPLLTWIPAPLYVLAAILLIQFASAMAKDIITTSTVMGLVFLRTFLGAILVTALVRPNLRGLTRQQWLNGAGLGVAMAIFTGLIYLALTRLPLALVVTIGFLGPLSVSLFGARRFLDFVWPVLGFAGVLLLTPIDGNTEFDSLGLIFAGLYALSWAVYILMSARSARTTPGFVGFSVALWFTALCSAPFGLPHVGHYLATPSGMIDVVVITVLATLPFALEFLALKRLSPAVFGVVLSSEPAIAAIVGLAMLGELLPVDGWLALGLVSVAALGSSLMASRKSA